MKIDAQVWSKRLSQVSAVAKKTALCEHGELIRLSAMDGGVVAFCTDGASCAASPLPAVSGHLDRTIHLPAKPLVDFISKSPVSDVSIEVGDDAVSVSCYGSSMRLSLVEAELPSLIDDASDPVVIPSNILSGVIKAVRYVASNDPADAALHGVEVAIGDRIIRTRAGSREGRIAEAMAGDGDPSSMSIALVSPSEADRIVAACNGVESVQVSTGSRSIRIDRDDGFSLICRTSDRVMHDIGAYLDRTVGELDMTISLGSLLAGLSRVSAVASPSDAIGVKVSAGKLHMSVESVSGVAGKASTSCTAESGQDWPEEVLIGHHLLTSTAKMMECDKVRILIDEEITHVVRVESVGGTIPARVGIVRMTRR